RRPARRPVEGARPDARLQARGQGRGAARARGNPLPPRGRCLRRRSALLSARPADRRPHHRVGTRAEVPEAMTTAARPDPLAFERVRLPSGATLHLNSTQKLKTILVKASFTGDLDATVTRKALLPMVLRRGTRRFPDMKAIHRHLEDLYGSSLVSDVSKIGEWHAVKFRLEAVNDRFLPGEKGVFREALAFLRELIHEPRLAGGSFDAGFLEQEKHNLRRIIEGLIDDKAQ